MPTVELLDSTRGSNPRVAVVLAAGLGSRLGVLTSDRPKCLLRLSPETTLVDRQLEDLAAAGVERVILVTGHGREALKRHLAHRPPPVQWEERYVPEFESHNNFYSLMRGLSDVDQDCLIANSDVLSNRHAIRELSLAVGSALLIDSSPEPDAEAMKVSVEAGEVTGISKSLAASGAREYVGIAKITNHDRPAYLVSAQSFLDSGRRDVYYEDVFDALVAAGSLRLTVVEIEHKWVEVDTQDDLLLARSVAEA